MLETQSKHAIAQAQLIEAQDNLAVAQLKLETLTGQKITRLERLSDLFNYRAIQLEDYDSWYAMAMERNAEIATQRHMVTSGKEEIRKSQAGHVPRIDLVASLSRNQSGSPFIAGREFQLAAAGIEVNIPLYSGGVSPP